MGDGGWAGPRGGVCATATHAVIIIWYMLYIMFT